MQINDLSIQKVVNDIIACLKTDSDIYLNPRVVKVALLKDLESNGDILLTEKEVEELVMGDDEGTISGKLQKLFPNLNKLLDEEF